MGTGLATGSDGKLYISVVFCTETNPGAASPPPAQAPPPPPPASASTAATTAVRAPQPTQVVAPPPAISVHDVFFRLVTGELHDLWGGVVTGAQFGPVYAPSPFLAMVDWSVTVVPSLS